ncbi:MAG: GNAT family N-acetyltransferase [Deltaproteobacteria bacterium]|nr:GNAT family N-acetyltransferase [Deltaproteobacteria bacterium]
MSKHTLRFETFNDAGAFGILEKDWESLCNELAADSTVFASLVWYRNWWKYYSEDTKLHLFTMWEEEKLVGIAPLMQGKSTFHGISAKTIGFIQNNQSLHNDFLVIPEFRNIFLQSLLESLFEQSFQWDVLYFRNISRLSDNYKSMAETLENDGRRWNMKSTPFDTPYLIPTGTWPEYFTGRSQRTRKTLKNIRNRVRKTGEFTVKNIRTREEFLSCKEEIFEVARHSWTESIGGSLGSAVNRSFYESLAFESAAKGWLSVWALYLNSKIIAVEFHLRAFGKEHALAGHYHPEFASLSPGTFLEMAILEHIFEEQDRLKVYDFCGAFDQYKKKWTDTYIPHCDVYIFKEQIFSRYIKFQEFTLIPLLKKTLRRGKILD